MVGGGDLAVNGQDRRCRGDANVINARVPEVRETRSDSGTGGGGHRHAPRAAMQVQTQVRVPLAERRNRGRENRMHGWIPLKDRSESVFNDNPNAKIRAK